MLKKLAILFVLVILYLSGCSGSEPERTWRDDFTVQCRHIEESQFDDPNAKLDALLNGTYIPEQDEYTITNNTNYVMESVKLIFLVDFTGYEPFQSEIYIGTMKQGETVVRSLTQSWIEIDMGVTKIPEGVIFDFNDCKLIRIEYEIED